MDITTKPSKVITKEDVAHYSIHLKHDNSKALSEVIDDLKNSVNTAFSAGPNELKEPNTDEDISVKSGKTKPKSVASGHADGFFQTTEAPIQPQSEQQDLNAALINNRLYSLIFQKKKHQFEHR